MRVFFENLIDYAGLFPPAGLDLPTAAANYARYRSQSPHAWMLGRFVCPAEQLFELLPHLNGPAWPLTVLVSEEDELGGLKGFAQMAQGLARIESIEAKSLIANVPAAIFPYYEIPLHVALPRGGHKLRTGGLTPAAFPSAQTLVDALSRRVPMKFTAGLHHPLPGEYPLTYEENSPSAPMHGFVNLFLAAAGLWAERLSSSAALELLAERDPASFRWEEERVRWRDDLELDASQVAESRRRLAHSFGSCSFEEPVESLSRLGWISA